MGAPSEASASSHGSYYFTTRFNAYRVVKVIETEMSILNQAEQKQHIEEVMAAMLEELRSWQGHNAWQLLLRKGAKNIIDSRWVIKWKMIDGKKSIKARLVVRGFKDNQGDIILTAASAASRWGQRLV